eukprot:jgi/Tetstr1/459805/TSEL_005155.t1
MPARPSPAPADAVEAALQADELGDGSRETRLQCRKQWHAREREAAEVRAKALAASQRRSELEEEEHKQEVKLAAARFEELSAGLGNLGAMKADVEALKEVVPPADFVSFILDTVLIRMTSENPVKELKLKFQYAEGFPTEPVIIDLEAPNLHPELAHKLQAAADSKVAALAQQGPGSKQAREAYLLVSHFLSANKLAAAFGDIQQIKQLCSTTDCALTHVRDKKGVVEVDVREGQYRMSVRLAIDEQYPASAPTVEVLQHNLPPELGALYAVQAKQKAAHLAEPPRAIGTGLDGSMARAGAGSGQGSKNARKANARQTAGSAKIASALVTHSEETAQEAQRRQQRLLQNFHAEPSLWPVVDFLHSECVLPLARDRCSVCGKHVVPTDPAKMPLVKKSMAPDRLYCGHLYHSGCLEEYIKRPPFDKGCQVCGKSLSHHKYCTDPKILQARHAFQRAHEREIADVAEFIS